MPFQLVRQNDWGIGPAGSCGISLVNFTHARMVTIAERAFGEKFRAYAQVFGLHRQQFVAELSVHEQRE